MCVRFPCPGNSLLTHHQTLRFHMLISLMLSSQTKDPVTSQAVTNLHHSLPGGLTADSLAAASIEQVHECINKVGFWRRKTDYIQDAARILLEKEGDEKGDVPNTLEGLCALRGVGPKMAFLALQVGASPCRACRQLCPVALDFIDLIHSALGICWSPRSLEACNSTKNPAQQRRHRRRRARAPHHQPSWLA